MLAAVLLLLHEGLRATGQRRWMFIGAAALLGSTDWVWEQSHNIRPYPLVLLWAVVTMVLVLRRVGDGTQSALRSVSLGCVVGLGMLTHYLFGPLALGAVVVVGGRRRWREALVVGAVAATLFAPWLLYAGSQGVTLPGHLSETPAGIWDEALRAGTLLGKYFGAVAGFSGRPVLRLVPAQGWFLAWLVACVVLLWRRGPIRRALGLMCLASVMLPFVVDLLAGVSLLEVDRAAVTLVPLTAAALAGAAARLRPPCGQLGVAGIAAVVCVASFFAAAPAASPRWVSAADSLAAVRAAQGARGASLVVVNSSARGDLLQRIRYLRSPADVVVIDSDRLADDVARYVPGSYGEALLLAVRQPCCGRTAPPALRPADIARVDTTMGPLGWHKAGYWPEIGASTSGEISPVGLQLLTGGWILWVHRNPVPG